jgi:hypothetical protein
MNYRKTTLQHARNNCVDLVVGESGGWVTTYVVIPSDVQRCHSADRLRGRIADIRFDQNGTLVNWEDCELPACCSSPEFDIRQKPNPPGFERTLDYLKYHVANAMVAAFSDRGFSRHFKKLVPGEWSIEGGRLNLEPNGHYELSGTNPGSLAGAPKRGRWYFGRNMLHLMADPPNQGTRTLVVGITDKELLFPGEDGILHYVYAKEV